MKHQLLHLPTLTLVAKPVEHWPAYREVGDPAEWTAPPDHAYVPILPRPVAGEDYDPATQTVERSLTAESYGWAIRDLTAEEIAARQPVPAKTVEVGGLKLLAEQFDQGEIAKVAVLYLVAKQLGVPPETVPISDVDGILHELPAAQFLQVVAGYGQAIHAEWTAAKKAEPKNQPKP